MARLVAFTLALGLVAAVSTSTDSTTKSTDKSTITSSASRSSRTYPVITVTGPNQDEAMTRGLSASLVGVTSSATTIVVGCPSELADFECPLVYAGTWTFAATGFQETFSVKDPATLMVKADCSFSATTAATCAATTMGDPCLLSDDECELGTATRMSTVMSTYTLNGTPLTALPVTITAGPVAQLLAQQNTTSTSASSNSSSSSFSSSQTESTATTTTPSGTGNATVSSATNRPTGAATALVPGAMTAGLIGLLTFLL